MRVARSMKRWNEINLCSEEFYRGSRQHGTGRHPNMELLRYPKINHPH